MVNKILVAIDGSDHAYRALGYAADMAKNSGAELVILNVISDKPLSDEERHLASTEYYAGMLDKLNVNALMDVRGDPRMVGQMLLQQYGDAGRLMRRAIGEDMTVKARAKYVKSIKNIETIVEEGDAAEVILNTAATIGADTIVLGSRGLGNLQGMMLGSVSDKVSHMAECACVIVK